MLNFTKGPWTCYGGAVYDDALDTKIARMDRSSPKCAKPAEWDANAKLISLAPEMFAALEKVADTLKTVNGETCDAYTARVSMVLLSERSRITRLISNTEGGAA